MTRPLAVSLAAGLALVAAAAGGAGESFPVVHNEPITVRILGGKDGQPLARLHLTFIAGYDRRDMREQLFREEVITDAHGQVRLSNQLANLPWLQVWVGKKSLCQEDAPGAGFSVELIRRDGLSAPNRCGKSAVEDRPGTFTVFVKGKGAAPAAIAPEPAPASVPAALPALVAAPATTPPAAAAATAPCSCTGSKKHRRGSACGRLVILLPGLALSLR